jgi:hypothetical protein
MGHLIFRLELDQPQIDLQGPAVASLLGKQIAQVRQHLDVIRIASQDAFKKLDLEIEL